MSQSLNQITAPKLTASAVITAKRNRRLNCFLAMAHAKPAHGIQSGEA